MTAHRMRASTSDSTLAGQLLRIFFIFEGEEFAEPAAQTFGIEVPFDDPAVTNRNHARFLRNHHDNRIGLLASPDCSAMTHVNIRTNIWRI